MKQKQAIIIDSWIPGPILTIIGWIHGNETCWIQAVDILRNTLTIKQWKIFLLYGNIEAIEKNVRQIDINLNRMFREENTFSINEKETVEYRRSREIIEYLDLSDALLDIHSSPSVVSPAFIICEENCGQIVENIPFDIRCYGFMNIEPGGTDGYMNSKWKIGICVECGNHNAPDALEKALISVNKFLQYYNMIDAQDCWVSKKSQEIFMAKYAYKTISENFIVAKLFADFEDIKQWQLIGYDNMNWVFSENPGKILFARNRNQIGVEWFLLVTKVVQEC